MYNRYIRDERGGYTRVPVEPRRRGDGGFSPPRPDRPAEPPLAPLPPEPPREPPPPPSAPPRFLSQLLEKLHLQDIETADLLLLLILFFLFEEKADDELLIALGLLLIL